MTARSLVRNVRRARRLSQSSLSARSGVAGSSLSQIESGKRVPTLDTVERLLASVGHGLIAVPTVRADAATIAGLIADAVQAERPDEALRHFVQLNDNLAAEHGEIRFALAIAEPAPTGVKHWDAAIAALAAHRLREEGLPIPSWTGSPGRKLGRAWTLTAGRYTIPVARDRVPEEFLARGVLVDQATLESV
jgi:transcriptional regulator with XRE-family HTH domain